VHSKNDLLCSRGEATVDEDELVGIHFDNFGWKVGRRRGACPDELPQRQIRVPTGGTGKIELSVRVIRDRPRRIGGRVAQYNHQQGPDLLGAECRFEKGLRHFFLQSMPKRSFARRRAVPT